MKHEPETTSEKPSAPKMPKPHLNVVLDDVQGLGELALDDRVTLLVTGRVTELSHDSLGGPAQRRMGMEIESMKRQHSSMSLSGHKP